MNAAVSKVAAGRSEMMISSGDTMISIDDGFIGGGDSYNGSYDEGVISDGMGMENGIKDPLLSSWLFVGGISAIMLAGAVVLGILLAKKRIKKGYDLYEI